MFLTELCSQQTLMIGQRADDKESAIAQMLECLCQAGAFARGDFKTVKAAVLKREELGSTAIGQGNMVPHTKSPVIEALCCCLAVFREGFDGKPLADDTPITVVFMILCPPDQPGRHLRALELVARRVRNRELLRNLRQAIDCSHIWDILVEDDENYGLSNAVTAMTSISASTTPLGA